MFLKMEDVCALAPTLDRRAVKLLCKQVNHKVPVDDVECVPGLALVIWLADFMNHEGILGQQRELRIQLLGEFAVDFTEIACQLEGQLSRENPCTVHRLEIIDQKYAAISSREEEVLDLESMEFAAQDPKYWEKKIIAINLTTIFASRRLLALNKKKMDQPKIII